MRPEGAGVGVVGVIRGVWGLGLVAVETRLRVRGPYWAWRMQTAYGTQRPGRGELLRDALAFGAWRVEMGRHR